MRFRSRKYHSAHGGGGDAFTGEIVFDGTKADGQYQKTCSNARLRAMRPDFAFTPMSPAIKETVTWSLLNY
jgi:GDP-L-fucose synthase